MLRPFLCAVRSEAPREGLLQSIERELDRMPADRAKGWRVRGGYLPMSVAATACIGITVLLFQLGFREDIALLDPTGRPVAHIRQDGGLAYVKLLEGSVTSDTDKFWHLWGIVSSELLPVHIGVLLDADTMIETPERFAGYAISMEDRGFSGNRPAGPVITLSVGK